METPDAAAVREPGGGAGLSWDGLWARSGRLAAALRGAGVRIGDTVAVDLPRSADLVVAFLGIVRAGAAYLPFDVDAPAARLAGILEESGTAFVVGCTGRRSWPDGVRTLPVDGAAPAHAVPPQRAIRAEDPVYVTYTSGSTGRPKGVVVPHRAVRRLVTDPNYCVVEPGDRVANTCNPAFDVTAAEIWGALAAGATVVPFPAFTGAGLTAWAELIRSERISTMFLPTSVFHALARERPDAFAPLRDLVVGGEQLDLGAARQVLAAGPPRRLVNGYGPTEGTAFATYFVCTPESLAGVERVPIGHPLQGTDLHVLDDALAPVADGGVGELCLGGPGVATGYLHRPDLTAERFVREPGGGTRVYRTGDMVRRLPSGALEMLGRRDRQVKLRGFRVELAEVERNALATGLPEAVFVERTGDGAAAALVGFALPKQPPADGGGRAWSRGLSAALAERVPEYMVPGRWVVLDSVPLGPTGKADRSAMLALLQASDGAPGPGGAPERRAAEAECGTLKIVRDTVASVLDVPLYAGHGFVELGGNSILAMRVVHRLGEKTGSTVPVSELLLAESLEGFAEKVCAMACHQAA